MPRLTQILLLVLLLLLLLLLLVIDQVWVLEWRWPVECSPLVTA
jgi:hypothetical protein